MSVVLYDNYGHRHRRSIAPMVVDMFIPKHHIEAYNESHIHLDGDKTNCHVDNLARRPRWFAMVYHRQFYDAPVAWKRMRVRMDSTDEVFDHAIDACIKYGLILEHVITSAFNPHRPYSVQPLWTTFSIP